MAADRPILLLTRPEAAARRFAGQFLARHGEDWPTLIAPLTAIVPLRPELPAAAVDAVVFTSGNAVAAFAPLTPDRSLEAWCVGAQTAEVARRAGFRAKAGGGNAAALAEAIIAAGTIRRVLYPRPVHVAGALDEMLDSAGIETVSIVVYDQVAVPPPPEAVRVMAGTTPVILPLFSPRSATLVTQAFAEASAPVWTVAISAAADRAFGLSAERRLIAATTSSVAMLEAIGSLIDSL